MIDRIIEIPKRHSFFLFGPRQTGKSTLLKASFPSSSTLYYNLLKSEEFLRLSANSAIFREEVLSRDSRQTHIIVDEIQRVPQLLNEVHALMEEKDAPFFVMSGSSARKLKRAKSNLLAGRAWSYSLYPLTHIELGAKFSLDRALDLGTLPSVYLSDSAEDAKHTLKAYVETYLKEEIQEEALVRNLGGFLIFLSLAGDENGNIINYSNIARETGTNYHTVKEYFQILEDTLIGFFLLPYHRSERKRLVRHPKFYFFDVGLYRTLRPRGPLDMPEEIEGHALETLFLQEIMAMNSYLALGYNIFYWMTSNNIEVDFVLYGARGIKAFEIKRTGKI